MTDTPQTAQVTYTTSPFLSPGVLGAAVTFIASLASAAGVHVLDNPMVQQQLILVIGIIGTAFAHWMWPHNDGKLSFNAPLSTPTPRDLPAGASIVNVSTTGTQETSVNPLPIGDHTVTVEVPGPLATAPGVTITQGTR